MSSDNIPVDPTATPSDQSQHSQSAGSGDGSSIGHHSAGTPFFADAILDLDERTITLGRLSSHEYTQTNFTQEALIAHFSNSIDVLETPATGGR